MSMGMSEPTLENSKAAITHMVPGIHISVVDITMTSSESNLHLRNATGEIELTHQQVCALLDFSRHFLYRDYM